MWVLGSEGGPFEARVADSPGIVKCHRTGIEKASYEAGDWIAYAEDPGSDVRAEFVIRKADQPGWTMVSGPA